MEFIYNRSILPPDTELLSNLHSSAVDLYAKLSTMNFSALDISDYNKKYLNSKLQNLHSTLQFSTYLLAWSLYDSQKKPRDFWLIEYGAGTGITSLLAKEMGIRVIYNDIYDVSVIDAKIIADSTGNAADHYLLGNIDVVLDFLQKHDIECNSMISSDVIEHVFDLQDFFKKLTKIRSSFLSLVMCSGANQFHPYIRRELMKKQRLIEYTERKKEYGHKERDTLKAYRGARVEIIHQYLITNGKTMSEQEIEKLADLTRGMMQTSIENVVGKYLENGHLPRGPDHPTNTCDPYTGNWAEHLFDPHEMVDILNENGFKGEVLPGYYGNMRNFKKRVIGKILDFVISKNGLGRRTITIAPFYTIYAKKRGRDYGNL